LVEGTARAVFEEDKVLEIGGKTMKVVYERTLSNKLFSRKINTNRTKEDAWAALGKKYGADCLTIYEKGTKIPNLGEVGAEFGFRLTWDFDAGFSKPGEGIHVMGDYYGFQNGTYIDCDEPFSNAHNVKKLILATKCQLTIKKNTKKYYC
jgi:hypothetical protein